MNPRFWFLALPLVLASTGCVTKSRAKAEAQAAFAAGQQEALSRMSQVRGPSVTVVGQVRNNYVPWTPELTLAKAIVAAAYFGTADPTRILVIRNGEQTTVESANLLAGEDIDLEAGDIIKIE